LLIEKGSGARGAESIHRKVADLEATLLFLDENQFGIFSPDIDDRPDPGIEILNRPGLGNNLIDEFSPQEFGEEFSSGASKRDRMKSFGGNPLKNLLQYPLNGQEGLPLGACIMFLQHLPTIVHDDGIRADGSDINAQIKQLHLLRPTPIYLISPFVKRERENLRILIDLNSTFQV
jgi:hypothetical protein